MSSADWTEARSGENCSSACAPTAPRRATWSATPWPATARSTSSSARQAAERRIAELDERIRDLEAQRVRLAEQVTAEMARWSEWLRQKRHYEKALAAGVGYLISERVVTVDGGEE